MSQSASSSERRASDARTRMGLPTFTTAAPFAEVFARCFGELDQLYRSFTTDGLLVAAAIDGRDLEAYLHVPLAGDAEFAVLGRHSQCDLRLGSDDRVSLRHVVVGARRRDNELRVRVLDLGTGGGVATEDGQRCEGLAADGAAFVTVGRYHLFLLPTGALAPLPWGATAAEAWAGIPERIYVDRRTSRARGADGPRVRLGEKRDCRSIATQIIDPPTALRERRPLPGARGPRIGALALRSGQAAEAYDVHQTDLARGLLIGRYDRCAFGADDERLSRVHLLLLQDGPGGDVWAVDTASSNGTALPGGGRVRQHKLGREGELMLAKAITLGWTQEIPEVSLAQASVTPISSAMAGTIETPAPETQTGPANNE